MPENNNKQVLKARTESHSDVAKTAAAKEHQTALTERQFGQALLRRLREAKGELRLRNYREEWISTDDGLVYEISAEAEQGETDVATEAAAAPAASED